MSGRRARGRRNRRSETSGSPADSIDRLDPIDREIEAELESHFEGTVELLRMRGWSEVDARAEAGRRFGDLDRYRADLRRIDRRRRRRRWARQLIAGVASTTTAAVRSLRRAPGFSAAVVLTLALGLGANAAVFRVADRLLLSPPDQVDDPATARRLTQTLTMEDGGTTNFDAFVWSDVEALRAAGLPARIAASATGLPETLGDGEGATRVRVTQVDAEWFPLVGVQPRLGRGFLPEDHRPDAAPVALLGHALWASRFGSDPDVVGRVLRIGGGRYEVVGVLPEGFVGARPPATDVWLPLEVSARAVWGEDWATRGNLLAFRIFARLEGPASAPLLSDVAATTLRAARGGSYVVKGSLRSVGSWSLVPGDGPEPGDMIRISRWLSAVAVLVLLVACANVANLFLAQGERVRREVTLRLALGAGRARMVGELLARSLVLALLGGLAALVLALSVGRVLDGLVLDPMKLGSHVSLGRLAGFVAFAAVAAAGAAGVLPALMRPRADLRGALDAGGRNVAGGPRVRRTLVAVQTALSSVLLIGALLFVGSLRAALDIDLGFDVDRVVMVRPEADGESTVPLAQLYREGRRVLEPLDGVESVTETVAVPFALLYGQSAHLPGQDPDEAGFDDGRRLSVNAVGPDYFRTLGRTMLRGRSIEESDMDPGAEPVVVVGRFAASVLWPGENPLGECLVVGRREDAPCARVVGVAEEHAGTQRFIRQIAPDRPVPMAWAPLWVAGRSTPAALLVRVRSSDVGAVEAVRRRLLEVSGMRYAEVTPLSDFVARELRSWRLGATVFSLFGVMALGIAVLGLYGVLAYEVARRRREIGVRMALGADSARLAGAVLLPALVTVVVGLAVALPVSAWIATRLDGLLYGISPRAPAVFVLTALTLLAGAVVSALVPAWRATHVDPRESLREA